jgi:hypothetical protein
MMVEGQRGFYQTMPFLVCIKLFYPSSVANGPLMCEQGNTVHTCINEYAMLTLLNFVYNLALGSSC